MDCCYPLEYPSIHHHDTIDIYRRKQKPYDSFIDFLATQRFSHITIVRSDHFRKEIEKPLHSGYRSRNCKETVMLIMLQSMQTQYSLKETLNIGLIWWATLCFGDIADFGIYGHRHRIDLLGINCLKISKRYQTSPQDFWRRWHISLSTWLRDYLYIPLGGSRNGTKRMLMMTMLLGGLWHGASCGFVHGLLLIIHRFGKNLGFMQILQITGKFHTDFMVHHTGLRFLANFQN